MADHLVALPGGGEPDPQVGMALVESRTLRTQYITRVDVLDKVKLLMTLPGSFDATTEMVATYYEVQVETIKKLVERNREELETNGYRVLQGSDLQELKGSDIMSLPSEIKYSSQLAIYSKRAVLNVGQLLTQSTVAQQVRAALLDGQRDLSRKELAQYWYEAEQRAEAEALARAQEALLRAEAEQERDQATKGMIEAGRVVTQRTLALHALEAVHEIEHPKAEKYDKLMGSEGLCYVGTVAKTINAYFPDGRAIGRDHLFKILRDEKILMSTKSQWNEPYNGYERYFRPVPKAHTQYDSNTGEPYDVSTFTTMVKPPGIEFIRRLLIRLGHDVPNQE